MFRWAVPLRGAVTRVRGKNVEGTGRGGRAYLQYSKRSDDSVPESHPRPFRQMLDVPLTWVRPWASHSPLPSTFQNGRGGTRSRTRSLIYDLFLLLFSKSFNFEFWRGFRWRWKYSKKDEFEDETIGELPSPGILEKFFLMEIRWFPFFSLTLKFRENSKSHRVVEMLQDIWRLLLSENENGKEWRWRLWRSMVDSIWWNRCFKKNTYFSLEYLHLLNDLINVAQIGFLTIGGGITWQKKKKMRKTKAHEIEEILSF